MSGCCGIEETACDITGLSRKQKKLRERLGLANDGTILPESVGSALPGAAAADGGITSPLREQYYTGDVWYQLTSSDGLFVFEFSESTPYLDGDGNALQVNHIDPDAPVP